MKRVAAALVFVCGVVCALQAQLNGVTAELKLDQTEYLPNEDMQLKVRIINRSGQDLALGQTDDWVTFAVHGNNALVTQLDAIPEAGAFTLHSDQTGARAFNLAPYFDIHQPGRYLIAATIKIPQWREVVNCKPVAVAIVRGVRVPNVAEVTVGVPPIDGDTNKPPEVRKYILQKATYTAESKLYLRITDAAGARTFRVVPLDRMISFSEPEAQIDRFSNIHVLNQNGARSFSYSVVNPLGQLLERETYDYTQHRPTLRSGPDGRILVSGGIRRFAENDIPPNN